MQFAWFFFNISHGGLGVLCGKGVARTVGSDLGTRVNPRRMGAPTPLNKQQTQANLVPNATRSRLERF
jgi:hypothetical protein